MDRRSPGRSCVALAAILAWRMAVAGAVPAPPVLNQAQVTLATVTIAWTAPSGAVIIGYRLLAGTGPGLSNAANTVLGNVTSLIATNVPPGVYYVRVRAIGLDGESAPSNEIAVVVGPGSGGCASPPEAPQLSQPAVFGNSVSFSWTPASTGCAATSFALHAGSAAGASNLAIVNVGTVRSFGTSAPNGTYYVRVIAQNAFGSSAASNEVALTITTEQTAPAFGPGQWRVGRDIQPGRYFVDPKPDCYWERQRGFSGLVQDVIANAYFLFDAGQWIVDILPTDLAFEANSHCGNWYTTPRHGTQTTITPGLWLVGAQIPPGSYAAATTAGCYWERRRDFTGHPSGVIASQFVEGGGNRFVTIAASDTGFGTDDECGVWTRASSAIVAAADDFEPRLEEIQRNHSLNQKQERRMRP